MWVADLWFVFWLPANDAWDDILQGQRASATVATPSRKSTYRPCWPTKRNCCWSLWLLVATRNTFDCLPAEYTWIELQTRMRGCGARDCSVYKNQSLSLLFRHTNLSTVLCRQSDSPADHQKLITFIKYPFWKFPRGQTFSDYKLENLQRDDTNNSIIKSSVRGDPSESHLDGQWSIKFVYWCFAVR